MGLAEMNAELDKYEKDSKGVNYSSGLAKPVPAKKEVVVEKSEYSKEELAETEKSIGYVSKYPKSVSTRSKI